MSEPHELSKNRRAHFARMRTEELENILRLDFQLPEGEGLDEDTILYICLLYTSSSSICKRQPVS